MRLESNKGIRETKSVSHPQFIHEENVISNNHWTESRNILNKHCPGINEEIEGFVKC